MAVSFSSNAWYSIQNFGNDFFLACQNVGVCGTGTNDLANAELFQLTTVNGSQPFYIRPKALNTDNKGNPYCVNINTGIPAIATCSSASAIWGIQNWDGQDATDGLFFFSSSTGSSQRLYLSNNQSYSLFGYSSNTPQTQQNLMQWAVSSRAAINDQSYSTVPAAITGGSTSATTTTSSSSSSNSTSSTSTASGSVTSSTASQSSDTTSTSPGAVSVMSSTITEVVTPTVTASPRSSGSSSTASASASASLVNGATSRPSISRTGATLLGLMLVLPQIWLL